MPVNLLMGTYGLNFLEQCHRLLGKRHHMRITIRLFHFGALHFGTRNSPNPRIKVKLSPFNHPQISRALEHQRGQQQRRSNDRATLIRVHGPEQTTKSLWIQNRRKLQPTLRRHSFFQALSDVALRLRGCRQSILVNLSRKHQGPVGRLNSSALFNFLKDGEQLHRLNFIHQPTAEPWKKVPLQLA